MIVNLMRSLIMHEKIKTTSAKAKVIKPLLDKLISKGKDNNLNTRREFLVFFNSNEVVSKILNQLSPKYKNRNGGYTKIIKLKRRLGDGAEIVLMHFI